MLEESYETRCTDCVSVHPSNWLSKSMSDADWHNTMTGHDSYVVLEESWIWERIYEGGAR